MENKMKTGEKRKGLLFVVSAPSGSGKTTICNGALEQVPDIRFSVSHTTRNPRAGEEHGKNYHFVSRETFDRLVREGRMAEWAEIYGNCYGTAKETIDAATGMGKDILFDIDERGAAQLIKVYPDLITVLILPPSLEVLRKRLVDRGTDDARSIDLRLQRAKEEMERMKWYKYVIENDIIEDAVKKFASVIYAERSINQGDLIEKLLQ